MKFRLGYNGFSFRPINGVRLLYVIVQTKTALKKLNELSDEILLFRVVFRCFPIGTMDVGML